MSRNYFISKRKPEAGDKGFIVGNRFINIFQNSFINEPQLIVNDDINWVSTGSAGNAIYAVHPSGFEISTISSRDDWAEAPLNKIFSLSLTEYSRIGYNNSDRNCYLIWTIGKPYCIKGYQIITCYKRGYRYGSNTVVLEGSDKKDGIFETIDTQSNLAHLTILNEDDLSDYKFAYFGLPNNEKKYLYYRLRTTSSVTHGCYNKFISFNKDIGDVYNN